MRILEVVTEHTGPVKILFEVLKDMLSETTIEFRCDTKANNKTEDSDSDDKEDVDEAESEEDDESDDQADKEENSDDDDKPKLKKQDLKSKTKVKDKDGMRIMAVDTSKTVLINLKLDAKNFTTFVCKKKRLSLGINLNCFYKLIKSMGKNDILTLYVDHDDKNYLRIKIDSPEDKKDSVFNLKLLDLDESDIKIPDITFDAVITMNSQEFHKLCREMNQIADYVEIKCLSDKIIFTCKGDFADRTTTYRTNDTNEELLVSIKHASTASKDSPQIVQGIYELKHLVLFSKCASLSNDIEIYMKNNYPLVIKYTVATLGRVLLCLTPINDEATKNANFSDEDELYEDDVTA